MAGQYLRTNYRATGGLLDATTLGAAIADASAAGGAGTITTGGGIVFLSMSGSFDLNGKFKDSTLGTLSLFYGSGNFGSGHLFYPVDMQVLSYSDVAVTDLAGGDSTPNFLPVNFTTSDSVWFISAMKISATGSATTASAVDARLLVWGFIVSAP